MKSHAHALRLMLIILLVFCYSALAVLGQPPANQGAQPLKAPQFTVVALQEIDMDSGTALPIDKDVDPNDVYAGEPIQITFDQPLSTASVNIDSRVTALEPTADTKVWRLFVPAFPQQSTTPASAHLFVFSGSSTDASASALTGPSLNLMVYPAPNAQITALSETVAIADPIAANAGIKQFIVVQGEGFFAPPGRVELTVGHKKAPIQSVSPDGKKIYALLDPDTRAGQQPVQLTLWNTVAVLKSPEAGKIQIVRSGSPQISLIVALIAFFTMAVFILWLVGRQQPLPLPRFVAPLLLERQNNSYSLSFFQFYWWSSILVLSWIFIFATRGFVNNDWNFPDLSGFAYTFLISLGTLVAAQATNFTKGSKGSGTQNPSLADLIQNGGVPAPERIQHFVWTLTGGIVYLVIIYQGYRTITTLPTIPTEMLVLMGISSAGYVGGKLVRRPGPIITQVQTLSDRTIEIDGIHLSKQCLIWLDDKQLPQTAIQPGEPDATQPEEFLTSVRIALPPLPDFPWFDPQNPGQTRRLVLVNTDAQQSEWLQAAPPPPSVPGTPAPAAPSNNVTPPQGIPPPSP